MAIGGVFNFFVKNDFSQDPVWVVIETWVCIDNDHCAYTKTNYEMPYYSSKQAYGVTIFDTRGFEKKGFFQNELIVKITLGNIDLNSKSTNIVNIY